MSDLREQMLKAGLVNAKDVKQAKHQDRVHRKEVGHEGIQAERQKTEQEFRQEQEARRRAAQQAEAERKRRAAEEEREAALRRRIRSGWMRDATGGNSRFFFVCDGVRITYLDLADQAVRRLHSGTAAIVSSQGAVRGEFCVVDGPTAASLLRDHREVILYWNRAAPR